MDKAGRCARSPKRPIAEDAMQSVWAYSTVVIAQSSSNLPNTGVEARRSWRNYPRNSGQFESTSACGKLPACQSCNCCVTLQLDLVLEASNKTYSTVLLGWPALTVCLFFFWANKARRATPPDKVPTIAAEHGLRQVNGVSNSTQSKQLFHHQNGSPGRRQIALTCRLQ